MPPDTHDPTATPKTALVPDLGAMPDRAVRAWTERMAVRPLDDRYAVESERGATYVVDPTAGTCTCPDSRYREAVCKHRRRVAVEITEGRVPPPGRREGTCIACDREAHVPVDGPALCRACDRERGEVVRDRETGDRLVVAGVTDRPAEAIRVPGTDRTVADYPTNAGYPADDPVVEAVYLVAWREADPRVYRFPHARLAPTGQRMPGAD